MAMNRTLRARQIVFYQGEATIQTYRIIDGLVRAYIIHDNGEEATVAYFGPDDIFPIASSFDIAPVTLFYYETVTKTEAEVMSHGEFAAYLKNAGSKEVSRFATRYLGALLHISALTQTTARAKLAHTLRFLSVHYGEKGIEKSRVKIMVKLTQQDLARLCSSSRETMSIELGKLKSEGVIIVKEKHYIVHLPRLNTLISDEQVPELTLR